MAEETRDMAGNTLDALHEQGQRLDRVEGDLYEVGLSHRQAALVSGIPAAYMA